MRSVPLSALRARRRARRRCRPCGTCSRAGCAGRRASASSTVTHGVPPRSRPCRASRRGAPRRAVSATTANTTWPWNSICPVGEHRIVAGDRADIVLAGNVGGGQHRDHAGRRAHRVEIEPSDLPARDRRAADRDVQRAFRLADVVDVGRAARDMLRRGVMRIERRTTRSRSSSARRSGSADIGGLPEAGDARLLASRRRRSRSAPCAAARARHRGDRPRSRAGRRSARSPRRAARSPRPSPAAGRDTPRSAPSRPGCARFGVAAMPPKAMRAPAMRVPSTRSLNAPITAEMSWSKRLEIL